MIELLGYTFFQNAIIAGIVGGIMCSCIGVIIFLKDIPFLGIALSHAAFAGAAGALLLGVHPLYGALLFCACASALLGPFSYAIETRTNAAIGIVFSFVMGLAFLWLSLLEENRARGLQLIWGNILTVSRGEMLWMVSIGVVLIVLLVRYYPAIKALLYNWDIAATSGINAKTLFYSIIFICGLVISMNLTSIGGILILSLLINPAAAAHRLTRRLGGMFGLAAFFGVSACLLGLYVSYRWQVPSGALIVLISSGIYAAAYLVSVVRHHG